MVGFAATLGIALHGVDVQASETATEDAVPSPDADVALDRFASLEQGADQHPVYPIQPCSRNTSGGLGSPGVHGRSPGQALRDRRAESMGDPRFDRCRCPCRGESTFEPARVDGEPADAGHSMQYVFIPPNPDRKVPETGSSGPTRPPCRAIGRGDRDKAEERLASLEFHTRLNLYEDAYLHVGSSTTTRGRRQASAVACPGPRRGARFAERHLPQVLFTNSQRRAFQAAGRNTRLRKRPSTYYLLRAL